MNLRINAQSTQASLFTQTPSAVGKWRIIAPTAAGDNLRLSSTANSMTVRLKEHRDSIMQWDTKVMGNDNRVAVKPLKLLDKAVSNIGKTLEDMKTLSMIAEREDLTDEERIDLQIQMINLQAQLFKDTYRMGLEIAGQYSGETPGKTSGNAEKILSHEINGAKDILIAMMEKMKERIASGDYTPRTDGVDLSDFTMVKFFYFVDEETGEAKRVGTATRLSFKGGAADMGLDAEILDDLDLSRSNANRLGVAVTNIACAKESTERIQKQIDDLVEFKKEFAEFYANVPEEGYYKDDGELVFTGGDGRTGYGAYSVYSKTEILNRDWSSPAVISPDEYGSGVMGGADVRIKRPRDKIEAFIQKADAFFKDKIFDFLGISYGKFDPEQIKKNAANAHTIKSAIQKAQEPKWKFGMELIDPDSQLFFYSLYIEDGKPKIPLDSENLTARYL